MNPLKRISLLSQPCNEIRERGAVQPHERGINCPSRSSVTVSDACTLGNSKIEGAQNQKRTRVCAQVWVILAGQNELCTSLVCLNISHMHAFSIQWAASSRPSPPKNVDQRHMQKSSLTNIARQSCITLSHMHTCYKRSSLSNFLDVLSW